MGWGGGFFSKRPLWLHRYMTPWDWLVRLTPFERTLEGYRTWYYTWKYDVQVEEVRSAPVKSPP